MVNSELPNYDQEQPEKQLSREVILPPELHNLISSEKFKNAFSLTREYLPKDISVRHNLDSYNFPFSKATTYQEYSNILATWTAFTKQLPQDIAQRHQLQQSTQQTLNELLGGTYYPPSIPQEKVHQLNEAEAELFNQLIFLWTALEDAYVYTNNRSRSSKMDNLLDSTIIAEQATIMALNQQGLEPRYLRELSQNQELRQAAINQDLAILAACCSAFLKESASTEDEASMELTQAQRTVAEAAQQPYVQMSEVKNVFSAIHQVVSHQDYVISEIKFVKHTSPPHLPILQVRLLDKNNYRHVISLPGTDTTEWKTLERSLAGKLKLPYEKGDSLFDKFGQASKEYSWNKRVHEKKFDSARNITLKLRQNQAPKAMLITVEDTYIDPTLSPGNPNYAVSDIQELPTFTSAQLDQYAQMTDVTEDHLNRKLHRVAEAQHAFENAHGETRTLTPDEPSDLLFDQEENRSLLQLNLNPGNRLTISYDRELNVAIQSDQTVSGEYNNYWQPKNLRPQVESTVEIYDAQLSFVVVEVGAAQILLTIHRNQDQSSTKQYKIQLTEPNQAIADQDLSTSGLLARFLGQITEETCRDIANTTLAKLHQTFLATGNQDEYQTAIQFITKYLEQNYQVKLVDNSLFTIEVKKEGQKGKNEAKKENSASQNTAQMKSTDWMNYLLAIAGENYDLYQPGATEKNVDFYTMEHGTKTDASLIELFLQFRDNEAGLRSEIRRRALEKVTSNDPDVLKPILSKVRKLFYGRSETNNPLEAFRRSVATAASVIRRPDRLVTDQSMSKKRFRYLAQNENRLVNMAQLYWENLSRAEQTTFNSEKQKNTYSRLTTSTNSLPSDLERDDSQQQNKLHNQE